MTFSEYAIGLFPYLSCGETEPYYFTELIGSFIKDAAMDSCQILKRKDDTKYRYVIGDRPIPQKAAQYIYEQKDKEKFPKWMWERMGDADSYDGVIEWLNNWGISTDEPERVCQKLLEDILLDIIQKSSVTQNAQETEIDLKLIDDIQEKIKALPRPAEVPVPEEATDDEQMYISELYRAYGDAECIDAFSADDLASYPEYEEDLDDRRIDFYAAETIRRGVMELGSGGLSGQFDVLKSETYDGVKDTARRKHENGYECMLSVMEQAVNAPVTNYLLSESPYWISARIKKGVCHHLVNDKKLIWVRRRKAQ